MQANPTHTSSIQDNCSHLFTCVPISGDFALRSTPSLMCPNYVPDFYGKSFTIFRTSSNSLVDNFARNRKGKANQMMHGGSYNLDAGFLAGLTTEGENASGKYQRMRFRGKDEGGHVCRGT